MLIGLPLLTNILGKALFKPQQESAHFSGLLSFLLQGDRLNGGSQSTKTLGLHILTQAQGPPKKSRAFFNSRSWPFWPFATLVLLQIQTFPYILNIKLPIVPCLIKTIHSCVHIKNNSSLAQQDNFLLHPKQVIRPTAS